LEAAPGTFGSQGNQSFEYTLKYRGRYETVEEFENIVIRANADGTVLRVKDIAEVELGKVTYGFANQLNGNPATIAMVFQTAGSNATQIINDCLAKVDELSTSFPDGIKVAIPMNNNDFLYASISKVIHTLIEAFILVFFVVYVFLSDLRSTLIPAIAIPVALIGTFFMLNVIGFSINLITLSALVLAIAIVVDDAIVVVEAVHAKLDAGYKSARKASIDAMSEIGTALVSITLVMMLVFIPVSFMSGTTGVFYRQFGLTMAIAIGFSALNALTLSPALCAIFLKPHKTDGSHSSLKERMADAYSAAGEVAVKKVKGSMQTVWIPIITLALLVATITVMVLGWFDFESVGKGVVACILAVLTVGGLFTQAFKQGFEKAFGKVLAGYRKCVKFFVGHKITSFAIVGASIVGLVLMMRSTPTALVPNEDTGVFFAMLNMPPGTSQERTIEEMEKIDQVLAKIPGIKYRQKIVGYSFLAGQGSTYGTFIVKLDNWAERDMKTQDVDHIIGMFYGMASQVVKDGTVVAFAPPMITGYSVTNGFELRMQDKTGGDINTFFGIVQNFLAQLNAQPEIQMAYTTFNPTFPQYKIDIDAAKARQAGLTTSQILTTLQGYFGSMYVSNFNRFGKIYRVMMQAPPEARVSMESMKNIKVKSASGQMASLDNFVTMEKVYGPDLLTRFNLFQSISVTGSPATGYSSGQALEAVRRVAAETLPTGYGYEFAGMTREEGNNSSNSTAIVFGICFLFVYLLLSAQYESYILPFSVIFSIPFGLMGSFIFAKMFGISNNIYLQIALIMLIGLLAKNAILIVEFALERRRTGMSVVNAAIAGAAARLRPILMTSLALIIGLLPMMFASGVGANGNQALGVGSIGGMLIGMILQLLVVPSLFVIFQLIQEKITPIKWKDTDNGGIESEIEQYSR
jgi:multidrug efflux pump subunit AcrB